MGYLSQLGFVGDLVLSSESEEHLKMFFLRTCVEKA